jgi:hypothetical protein
MVDVNIASNTEYIENRQSSGTIQYECVEGDLVAVDSNGDVVEADAASGVSGKARGVVMGGAKNLSNYGSDFDEVSLVVESEYDLVGEARKTFFERGIRVRNEDEDWDFTPGADIYLAESGGFTETKPSSSGSVVQYVGYAKPGPTEGSSVANEVVIDIDQTATETVA